MSQLFSWGGQSIGVSASASVLPMNTQVWSPLGWTGWIFLQSKGLSRVFSNTTVFYGYIFISCLLFELKSNWKLSLRWQHELERMWLSSLFGVSVMTFTWLCINRKKEICVFVEIQGMLVFSFPSSALWRDWNVTLHLYFVMVRESTE